MVMLSFSAKYGSYDYESDVNATELMYNWDQGVQALDRYLMTFSRVKENKRVWEAFLRASKLDLTQAFTCIQYATLPVLTVRTDLFYIAKEGGHGGFDRLQPNHIKINPQLMFALGSAETAQKKYEAEKQLEKLILHEMVHWGRFLNGQPDEYIDDSFNDEGDKFAREAYNNPALPHL